MNITYNILINNTTHVHRCTDCHQHTKWLALSHFVPCVDNPIIMPSMAAELKGTLRIEYLWFQRYATITTLLFTDNVNKVGLTPIVTLIILSPLLVAFKTTFNEVTYLSHV